jgi:hypothetical protein
MTVSRRSLYLAMQILHAHVPYMYMQLPCPCNLPCPCIVHRHILCRALRLNGVALERPAPGGTGCAPGGAWRRWATASGVAAPVLGVTASVTVNPNP